MSIFLQQYLHKFATFYFKLVRHLRSFGCKSFTWKQFLRPYSFKQIITFLHKDSSFWISCIKGTTYFWNFLLHFKVENIDQFWPRVRLREFQNFSTVFRTSRNLSWCFFIIITFYCALSSAFKKCILISWMNLSQLSKWFIRKYFVSKTWDVLMFLALKIFSTFAKEVGGENCSISKSFKVFSTRQFKLFLCEFIPFSKSWNYLVTLLAFN